MSRAGWEADATLSRIRFANVGESGMVYRRISIALLFSSVIFAGLCLTGCSFDGPEPNGFSGPPSPSVFDVPSPPVSTLKPTGSPSGKESLSSSETVVSAVPTSETGSGESEESSNSPSPIVLSEKQILEGFDWAKTIAEQAFYMKPLWTPVYAEGGEREYKNVSFEDASTVRFFMTTSGAEYLEKAFENKGEEGTDSLITSLIFVPKYPPAKDSMWAYPAVHNIHFSKPKIATGEYDPTTGLPVVEFQFTVMGETSYVIPGQSCQVIDVSRDVAYLLMYDPEDDALPWRLDKWSGSEPEYSNSRLALIGQDEEKCYLPPTLN